MKYKYALIVLAIGIVLMLLPFGNKESMSDTDSSANQSQMDSCGDTESRLQEILAKIDGVGKVRVMLTTLSGEEVLYQTNGSNSSIETGNSQTVVLTGTDRGQYGLVRKVLSPTYLGAVVVCQGGGKATVKIAVTDAVSKATGLKTNQITVLKME